MIRIHADSVFINFVDEGVAKRKEGKGMKMFLMAVVMTLSVLNGFGQSDYEKFNSWLQKANQGDAEAQSVSFWR